MTMTSTTTMRYSCLLLLLISFLAISHAYGQRKAKVDTVAAFRANNEGQRLELAAKYDSAITHYQLASEKYKGYALSLAEKQKWAAPKKRAWEQHFIAKAGIGWCLNSKGQLDSALRLLKAVKTNCIQVLGDSNLAIAQVLSSIGTVYLNQGKYVQAIEYYQQALVIRKHLLGDQHPDVAKSYIRIGVVYSKQGQYSQALDLFQNGINTLRQALGEQHLDVAKSYNSIGILYLRLSQYQQALDYHQQALAIQKQALGEQHTDVVESYNNMGNVYINLGQYAEAIDCFQRALAIWKEILGEQQTDVAGSYNNLGAVYFKQGLYNQSLKYFQRALVIWKQNLGEQHPLLATTYNNIGKTYIMLDQYVKSLEYFQLALAIQKKTLGEQHPGVALSYSNMGVVYLKQRQYTKALEYFQQALIIRKQSLGEQHLDLAYNYNNIGVLFLEQKQYSKALEYFQQALIIRKQSLGVQHPEVASSYNNIGNVYSNQGQYAQALEYNQQALIIQKQALNVLHPNLAITYNNFSSLYLQQQQYSKAIETYQQSLSIFLPNYSTAGYRSLVSNSPDVLKYPLIFLPQACLLSKAPDYDTLALATVRFADRYIDSLRRAFTYETDNLEFGTNANILYQVAIDVAKWNKQDEEAFYYSEKNKAAVLSQSLNEATALKLGGIPDSLLEKDKELRTLVAFYTKASIDEELQCPKCDSTKLQNIKKELITNQQQQTAFKARLESEFTQYYALKYKDATITVKEVQKGFLTENPNSAILEYLLGDTVLYAFCITQDKYSFHRQKLDTTRFKNTNSLQLEVKKLGRALADVKLFLDPTTAVSIPSSALYDYLIKPFESQIQGKDLIIIPDAELNKIPFEILVKPNPNLKNVQKWQDLPYLIKENNISYHYSARLLLEDWQKNKTQPVKSSGFVAFAPVFDDTSTGQIVSNENSIEKSYLTYLSREDTVSRAFTNDGRLITPLPGTEREVKAIYELFNQKNQPAKYYLNDQANEATVKSLNLKPYKYLHFATHGLTDEDRPTNSCLILAQKQDSTSDNLLTSSEMYGLELDAELVVLSACQTGKGTLKAGEGIIGLTRGLLYAGARNLMVSQWNVNDASTAELMTKFYSKVLAGQSNRQALREAKLELLNSKFACPHYWSAFVLVGR
jgi:CHAT domain-containing protein/Tfp pilus assembly protein PilF